MPSKRWQRLKKRTDLQNVQKQGQALKLPALVFLYAPGRTDENRLGFTATRRTVGNAVQRNRAKRRMRALAQAVLEKASPQTGRPTDAVMVARRYIETRDFAKMTQELEQALKQEGFTFES